MARWGIAAVFGLIVVLSGSRPAAAQVAYLNTDAILRQTPGYEAVDSTLSFERAVFQQEADSLQAQLAAALAVVDQQDLMLSQQAREEQLDDLQGLNDRMQARLQEMQNLVLARQRELIAPLEQRIQTVIDGVRAERALAIIFDAANPNSTIISADPALDLTSLVISRLQSAGPS